MSKAIPSIQKFMSNAPYTIGPDQPLALAHTMMREHQIRHLPVLHGGKLVGMLTARDLALVETLEGVRPSETLVEDAMSTNIYQVEPDAPLDEVTSEMAEHKYGSAVVASNGKVVGIFTTVDACRALTELLHTRLKS